MPRSQPKRQSRSIFLSYARDDDGPFVSRLRQDLARRGFKVWFDQVDMPSRGQSFPAEIREAIDTSDRFVLVVGPGVATSSWCRAEWRHANIFGSPITILVRKNGERGDGTAIDGFDLIPRELRLQELQTNDFRDDESYEAGLELLTTQLAEPVAPAGKLAGVPALPAHLLRRHDRVQTLRKTLLSDFRRPVGITGVHGMGGIGKSVLANLLARDPAVRRSFRDGVFWVSMGIDPELLRRQTELASALGYDGSPFGTVEEGRLKLGELLEPRSVLLILDAVWNRETAEAFNMLGPKCRLVLTTRDRGLVTSLGGTHYELEFLSEAEASLVLARAAGVEVEGLPDEAKGVARLCGNLPLALALSGGLVRRGFAWDTVLKRLEQADLERIDDQHPYPADPQHRSVSMALGVSVDALSDNERERFLELGVFRPGSDVPAAAARTLWSHTGNLDADECEELLVNLRECSLLLPGTADRIALHDLVYAFVAKRAEDAARLQKQLLAAYRAQCDESKTIAWTSGPDDGYYREHLAYHLVRAGQAEELQALLFDFEWLVAKMGSPNPYALDSDFQLLLDTGIPGSRDRLNLTSLRELTSGRHSAEGLATTLWGNFASTADTRLLQLLGQSRRVVHQPWLRPITPSLSSAGTALIHRITDAGVVDSLAIGDTDEGHPIVVSVSLRDPPRVSIYLSGLLAHSLPLPDGPFMDLEGCSRSGDHSVQALNLPGDLLPTLLHLWKDPSCGTCCRLKDLSGTSIADCDELSSWFELDDGGNPRADSAQSLGPTMILGKAEAGGLGRVADRLVLFGTLPTERPRIIRKDGKPVSHSDLQSRVDDRTLEEFRSLVLLDFEHDQSAPEYLEKLRQLARHLASELDEEITLDPPEVQPTRSAMWDVETGQLNPGSVWPIPSSCRALLVGESGGAAFVVLGNGESNAFILRAGSREPASLGWMSWGDTPILAHCRGRPMVVMGDSPSFVIDVESEDWVGKFSDHLDNVKRFATVENNDGAALIASVGSLASRGRFSTSVRIWDLETQTQVAPTGTEHTGEIGAVTSGTYRGEPVFATGSHDLICVWRAAACPGYSVDQESSRIIDPNVCGRLPLDELPRDYRHHDLGAVTLLGTVTFGWMGVSTWSAARSNTEALEPTLQRWKFAPEGPGLPLVRVDQTHSGNVASVTLKGEPDYYCVIQTRRRDGTIRSWMFSPRADWERQATDWHYWHCVGVTGELASGTRINLRVDRTSGEVTLQYASDRTGAQGSLKFDPGCPATQCALGEDRESLVVFDERGIAHHLELVFPTPDE